MSPSVRVTFRAFLSGGLLLSAVFLLCIYIVRCFFDLQLYCPTVKGPPP